MQRVRQDRHLSANAFARLAGVNIRTLSNLESAETWPWESNRNKFEKALGWELGTLERLRTDTRLSLDELMGKEDPEAAAEPEPSIRQAGSAAFTDALGQLRAANIAVAAERMALLPAEDIARVQALIDELGRARFPDWDDQGDYDLAWGRRAKLGRLAPEEEDALFESMKDVQ